MNQHPAGTLCLVGSLALTACATDATASFMTREMSGLVGQDIHHAIERLGLPRERGGEGGEMLYTWSFSSYTSIPQPPLLTVTGVTPDGVPVFTPMPQLPVIDYSNCTIELGADSAGKILHARWDGDDCSSYIKKLVR